MTLMVNITYDSSGSIIWRDPDSGESFVYNPGDIAWVLASTALVWIMVMLNKHFMKFYAIDE